MYVAFDLLPSIYCSYEENTYSGNTNQPSCLRVSVDLEISVWQIKS